MESAREQYTATTTQIADLHGVTTVCVNRWVREGAFRFARRNSPTGNIMIHKSHLNESMGQVKKNLKNKTYINQGTMIIRDRVQRKDVEAIKSKDLLTLVDRIISLESKVAKLSHKVDRYEQIAAFNATTEMRL